MCCLDRLTASTVAAVPLRHILGEPHCDAAEAVLPSSILKLLVKTTIKQSYLLMMFLYKGDCMEIYVGF